MTFNRFNLHSIKSVTVDELKTVIIFETLFVNGHVYYFSMTKDEFLNFDEALFLISKDNFQGNIPIGDDIWFSYFHKRQGYEIKLWKQRKDRILYFDFDYDSFNEYKKTVHWKLFSFLRLKATEYDERRKRQKRNRYKSRHDKSIHDKCPLSNEDSRSYQSTRNGETSERETSSGATNNVNMSFVNKTSSVLSKWSDSTTRRKHISSDNEASDIDYLSSPETVQILNRSITSEMEV